MFEVARSESDGMWYIDLEKGGKAIKADNDTSKEINGTPNDKHYNMIKRGI